MLLIASIIFIPHPFVALVSLFLSLFLLASHQHLEQTLNYCKHVGYCTAQTSDRVQLQVTEALKAPRQAGDSVRFLLSESGLPWGG